MTELEQLKKENEELKEILKENAKLSDIVGRNARLWFRIALLLICGYIGTAIVAIVSITLYFYNTEPIPYEITTTDVVQDGTYNNHSFKSSNGDVSIVNSDIPLTEVTNGETKDKTGNSEILLEKETH